MKTASVMRGQQGAHPNSGCCPSNTVEVLFNLSFKKIDAAGLPKFTCRAE